LWSIILAGGEGERTRAFVEQRLGYHKPKQYCTFVGTRSMFQHTVDRADALASPAHRTVVAAPAHRPHVFEQLRGREEGRVIFQPVNRGTAAGILLALAHVLARDSDATVVIYPSDHFVQPEGAFLASVRKAVGVAQTYPHLPVLLGARPDSPEPDYGWIVPSLAESNGHARQVERFLEKPPRSLAEIALRQGALWNTLVVASRADSLWRLAGSRLPAIMPAFERYLERLRAGGDDGALEEMYRHLPSRDFSSEVLQRAPRELRVFELKGLWWSDWGRPERILETLSRLRNRASFAEAPGLPAGGERTKAGNSLVRVRLARLKGLEGQRHDRKGGSHVR
jgi:mannose-1-phosphate guanylyltransferase